MVEQQFCFEIKEVGANLSKEHSVFHTLYLIDIFAEFYPEFFAKKIKSGKRIKYNTKELFPFILWGKNNDKESCRKLEKWCDNNDESCQLVLKCEKPGKDTINRFKNNNVDLIDAFDQFLIDLGLGLGLIDGKIVYADGTILKAWCNTFKKMYPDEITYLKKFIQDNIKNKKLWNKLQKYYGTDESDDKLKEELKDILEELDYNLNNDGIHLLKLSLDSSKSFQKVLERINHMEENIDGENSVSIIDPESRHMPDKKGNMGLNYNYQTVTDNKYGFRIAHYITNASNDQKEAKKLVDLTTKRLHTNNYTICFDNGYWDEELLTLISKENTRVVIPYKTDATRKNKENKNKNKSGKRLEMEEKKNAEKNKNNPKRINKHEFPYNGKLDIFTCPKTKERFEMKEIVTITGKQKKKYSCDYCLKCKFKKECTSQHRRIIYEPYNPYIEEIRKLYYSDEGQTIYYQRGHFAETSFAVLLESRNFRGIKTKGLEKVNNELTLYEIHHNIKKYEKHVSIKILKFILKYVREYKRENNSKIDFFIFDEIREKLIIENDIIIGLKGDKKTNERKRKNTIQTTLNM